MGVNRRLYFTTRKSGFGIFCFSLAATGPRKTRNKRRPREPYHSTGKHLSLVVTPWKRNASEETCLCRTSNFVRLLCGKPPRFPGFLSLFFPFSPPISLFLSLLLFPARSLIKSTSPERGCTRERARVIENEGGYRPLLIPTMQHSVKRRRSMSDFPETTLETHRSIDEPRGEKMVGKEVDPENG